MKVIDLLNKIANGEEVPKKICFCSRIFEFSRYKQDYICRDNDETGIYGMSICKWLFSSMLNDEVKILDIEYLNSELGKKLLEPFYRNNKIEKLKHQIKLGDIHEILISINKVAKKVNELIDAVNKLKEKK